MTLIDSTPVFNDYNINLTSSGVTAFSALAVAAKGAQLRMNGFTGAFVNRPGFWNQTTPIWAFDAEL